MQAEDIGGQLLIDACDLLAAWRERLVRDEILVAWADEVIDRSPLASVPEWLLDLSMYGPRKCMSRPSSEFIAVPVPAFSRALAIRASVLDLQDDDALRAFVRWVSRACMGEDLDDPAVKFGYYLDHLWGDCDLMDDAVAMVRAELPGLLEGLPPITAGVLSAIVSSSREAG